MLTQELYWVDRLTYPTRRFRPEWVRGAAAQDRRMARGIPRGRRRGPGPRGPAARGVGTDNPAAQTDSSSISSDAGAADAAVSSLSTPSPFVPLGPKPERMTGCSGCFDYTTTSGRINSIVVDPTTTTNGSIVAYAASVGGGVWKTTNCCSASTSWTVVTDDPLVSTTSIDSVTIDPSNHNTIYAGTGDLNYGSFSMGSQGILKSTDAGATWTVLGADVFGIAYPVPAGQFPQYQAVGKVRVDPINSNIVVAGTKTGLYLSYDGGVNWTGPCLTNSFPTQRQDITGLELTDVGGSTRILAAVGARGFATTVQFDLGANGANGIYSAAMPANGCPAFTSIASNANGFVFGTAVTGSPYTTGANMNAGSGSPYVSTTTGNQVGRIDLAVAPSNPNVDLRPGAVHRPQQQQWLRQRQRLPARRVGHHERRRVVELHDGLRGRLPASSARIRARDLPAPAAETIPRTGTTRRSPSTRTIPIASSSTRSTSGSRAARARRSTTRPAGTAA